MLTLTNSPYIADYMAFIPFAKQQLHALVGFLFSLMAYFCFVFLFGAH
jgi:purine-cytosine permease-like protein